MPNASIYSHSADEHRQNEWYWAEMDGQPRGPFASWSDAVQDHEREEDDIALDLAAEAEGF